MMCHSVNSTTPKLIRINKKYYWFYNWLYIYRHAASVVSSVKYIGSWFRLLERISVAVCIKAKMCSGMKVGYLGKPINYEVPYT